MMANNIIKRIWNQNRMVQIEDLNGMAFQAEDGGHTFQIYGVNDAGETVALSGTPSGVYLRPDNTDVVLDCSVTDGVVSATLPDECYVPGRGGLTVFITDGDNRKTAIYAAIVTVSRSSSGNVAPPATETVVDLVNAIAAAVATIPASYSDLMADIAPTYSSSSVYAVGQYAWYNGDLKRCIVPITTAESYTAAHWTSAVLGNDLSDLKSALSGLTEFNSYNLLYYLTGDDKKIYGVTYTWDEGSGNVKIEGTSTNNNSFSRLYGDTVHLPDGVVPGKTYRLIVRNAVNAVIRIGFYNASGSSLGADSYTQDTDLTIPSDAVGMYFRAQVANGLTANETIHYALMSTESNDEIATKLNSLLSERIFINDSDMLPDGTDIDTVVESGSYGLNSGYDYGDNCPIPSGLLLVFNPYRLFFQIAIGYTTYSDIFIRRKLLASTSWSEWFKIPYVNTYNNYNTYNNTSNTYNVTATPTITTDTNNYLASSGTTADRTNDIVTMLSTNKVCHLGPGSFYVKNLVMPDNTRLYGCGKGTRITLINSNDAEYAVKMGSGCSISDLWLYGQDSEPTSESEIGTRCGILWQGTVTGNNSVSAPEKGIVSNVWISSFAGCGIKCENTFTAIYRNMDMVNSYIWNCGIGINTSEAEFNKFTNIIATTNKIGCVNNGGNNTFIACDFSGSKTIGFLMDNGTGIHENNSHGSAIGCVFNHIASNTGIGVKAVGCNNGFVFDGCQFFFSQIYIEDSDGIVVCNSNFGATNVVITVTSDCGVVLFSGNMHQAQPGKTIANQKTHFSNCYVRDTGAVVDEN